MLARCVIYPELPQSSRKSKSCFVTAPWCREGVSFGPVLSLRFSLQLIGSSVWFNIETPCDAMRGHCFVSARQSRRRRRQSSAGSMQRSFQATRIAKWHEAAKQVGQGRSQERLICQEPSDLRQNDPSKVCSQPEPLAELCSQSAFTVRRDLGSTNGSWVVGRGRVSPDDVEGEARLRPAQQDVWMPGEWGTSYGSLCRECSACSAPFLMCTCASRAPGRPWHPGTPSLWASTQ